MNTEFNSYDRASQIVSKTLILMDITAILTISYILWTGFRAPLALGLGLAIPLYASSVWFPLKRILVSLMFNK